MKIGWSYQEKVFKSDFLIFDNSNKPQFGEQPGGLSHSLQFFVIFCL
jgi:hypothetical protein